MDEMSSFLLSLSSFHDRHCPGVGTRGINKYRTWHVWPQKHGDIAGGHSRRQGGKHTGGCMWNERKDSFRDGSKKIVVQLVGMNPGGKRVWGVGSRLGNTILGRNFIKGNGGKKRRDLIYFRSTWITVQIVDLFNLIPL